MQQPCPKCERLLKPIESSREYRETDMWHRDFFACSCGTKFLVKTHYVADLQKVILEDESED